MDEQWLQMPAALIDTDLVWVDVVARAGFPVTLDALSNVSELVCTPLGAVVKLDRAPEPESGPGLAPGTGSSVSG